MQQLSLVLRSFKGAALGPPDAGCQVFITENSACCGSVCSAAGCAPPDVGRAHAAVSTAARPYHCSEMAVLTINPSSSKYLRCVHHPDPHSGAWCLFRPQDLDAAGLVALTAALSTAEHQSEGTDQLLKVGTPRMLLLFTPALLKGGREGCQTLQARGAQPGLSQTSGSVDRTR